MRDAWRRWWAARCDYCIRRHTYVVFTGRGWKRKAKACGKHRRFADRDTGTLEVDTTAPEWAAVMAEHAYWCEFPTRDCICYGLGYPRRTL